MNTGIAFQEALNQINRDDQILPETTLEGVSVNTGKNNDNPAEATFAMCEMLESSGVVSLIGTFSSNQVRECSFIAGQMGLPLISPTASDPYLNNQFWSPTLARLSPTNNHQAEALVDLLQHFRWSRVSIIYNNDPYGLTLREAVKEQLVAREMTLITEVMVEHALVRDLIPPSMSKRWIEELLSTSTRVTLLLVQPGFADVILAAAEEHNMVDSVYAWVASTAITQSFIEAFEEGLRIKPTFDGLIGLSPYIESGTSLYSSLNKAYKKQGAMLMPVDALVYDAVYLIAHSLDEVYRTNPGILITNLDGSCFQDSYEWELGREIYDKFTSTNYRGITGHSQMWPNRHPDRDVFRYNIVNFNRYLNAEDSVSTIGSWNPADEPPIRVKTEPIWANGIEDVPSDNPMITDVVLKLGVLEDKPFIIYNYTLYGYPNCSAMPNQDWCYTGVSIKIIKYLQEKLNFKYTFVEAPDGKFGNEVNGVWNGIINEVREKRIDVGVVGFGTSHSREKVVNFGISFYPGGVMMATSKDVSTTDYFFFLRPFSTGVWSSILMGIVFFFLAVYLLDRFSPYGNAGNVRSKCRLCRCYRCLGLIKRGSVRDNLCPFKEDHALKHDMNIMSAPNALWLSICSFLAVAPADGLPKNWSGRIMITIWWMICLVMVSMYTANLAAFLTVSNKGVDISSVEDLLGQEEYAFGTVEGSITANLLLNSDSPKLREVYERSDSTTSYKEAVARMKLGNYIFLYGKGPLDMTTSENCHLELIGDVLVDFGYAFAFQIASPFIEAFNREMLIMQERGMIKDLWFQFVKGHCDEDSGFDAEADSLAVVNLLGILILCSPILALVVIVFLLEILASPKKKNGKRLDLGEAMDAVFDDDQGEAETEDTIKKTDRTRGSTYEVPNQASSLEYISPIFDQSVHDLESMLTSNNYPTVTETPKDMGLVKILTDASVTGWGATNLSTRKHVRGYWREEEVSLPAHLLELKAVYLALKTYIKHQDNAEVQVNLDNQFAIDIINGKEMASTAQSQPVSFLKRKIWELVLKHNITLTAQFLDGSKSISANMQSRLPPDPTDWTIPDTVYEKIRNHFSVSPEIDLFASWITTKCPIFVSKSEDPKGWSVDAFRQDWDNWDCVYCFPPLEDGALLRVAHKVSTSKSKVLLVIPWAPRTKWFLDLQRHRIAEPLPLGRGTSIPLIHNHDRKMTHPLGRRLKLVAVLCQSTSPTKGGFVPEATDTDMSLSRSKGLPPRSRGVDPNAGIRDISGSEFLKKN